MSSPTRRPSSRGKTRKPSGKRSSGRAVSPSPAVEAAQSPDRTDLTLLPSSHPSPGLWQGEGSGRHAALRPKLFALNSWPWTLDPELLRPDHFGLNFSAWNSWACSWGLFLGLFLGPVQLSCPARFCPAASGPGSTLASLNGRAVAQALLPGWLWVLALPCEFRLRALLLPASSPACPTSPLP